MTTRANWFTDLVIPEEDLADPPERVEAVGEEFALDPEVHSERFLAFTRQEQTLHGTGVRCAIKQDPGLDAGQCCHACPMRRTAPDDPMTALCDVGLGQEKALTALAVLRWNATGRAG